MSNELDNGKAAMRGFIHTSGIAKATVVVADMYAAPGNTEERDMLAGMILAAYEAGQLSGINLPTDLMGADL